MEGVRYSGYVFTTAIYCFMLLTVAQVTHPSEGWLSSLFLIKSLYYLSYRILEHNLIYAWMHKGFCCQLFIFIS